MKYYTLLALAIALLFTACSGDENGGNGNNNNNKLLPSSTGGFDEVLIVMDDAAWDGPVGDTLFYFFTKPYPILPTYEPVIDIVGRSEFEGMNSVLRKHHHIVFVGSLDKGNATVNEMKAMLDGNDLSKAQVLNAENVWSKPQLITFLVAPTSNDLVRLIDQNSDKLIKDFLERDKGRIKKLAFASGVNEAIKKQLKDYYGYTLDVPTSFEIAENDGSFVWFRQDVEMVAMNIVVDVVPLKEGADNKSRGIELLSEKGTYIETGTEGDYMLADSTLGFEQRTVSMGGATAYETKGLWEAAYDFVGGPFMNYYIPRPDKGDAIFLQAFIFAPGEDKRVYMRQLEVILQTFQLSAS